MTDASDDHKLQLAKELVIQLETGSSDTATAIIAQLAGFRESMMFEEVGRLARELHDSINSFMLDSKLAEIAQSEIPDATERLNYVITMTEEAANKTMDAVDAGMPLAENLRAEAAKLSDSWDKFKSRQLTVEDFRLLSDDITSFLEVAQDNSQAVHDRMSDILMAQGFQDLTGQVIRKVIKMVHEVETKLIDLLLVAGQEAALKSDAERLKAKKGKTKNIEAAGPAIPGLDEGDIISGQDDVDDLLSSLGF